VKTYDGILDRVAFPDTLTAHVVEPTADPRIHGFAVQADLARHTSFLDVGWLALTGEHPSEAERTAFSTALTLLAPLHVGDGPVHAAVLSRIAGAPDHTVPGVATVALGQLARVELQLLAPLFEWLADPLASQLSTICTDAVELHPTAAQVEAHEALAAASAGWFGAERALPVSPVLTRVAAAHALLFHLGIRDSLRLHGLSIWARLPVVLAEAACTGFGAFMSYPADLPPYRYVEDAS
jgi:hypothetical protein